VVRSSGVSLFTLGPFFDDKRSRCGDCYAARFWRAYLVLVVLMSAAIVITSAFDRRPSAMVVALAVGGLAALLCDRRARVFERRARPMPGDRD